MRLKHVPVLFKVSRVIKLALCVSRWVREFLNEDNKGLDVLVEYLSFAQYAVT